MGAVYPLIFHLQSFINPMPVIKNNEFDIEFCYQRYLQQVKLNEKTMSPTQRTVMRYTFWGACGVMLLCFRNDISAIENEDDAVDTMQDMIDQVDAFWKQEMQRYETEKKKENPTTLDEVAEALLPSFHSMPLFQIADEESFIKYCQMGAERSIANQILSRLKLHHHESPLHQHFLSEYDLYDPLSMTFLILRTIYSKLIQK